MSQSQKCMRQLRAMPLQNIIATSGESFICVGYNHPKERQVPLLPLLEEQQRR